MSSTPYFDEYEERRRLRNNPNVTYTGTVTDFRFTNGTARYSVRTDDNLRGRTITANPYGSFSIRVDPNWLPKYRVSKIYEQIETVDGPRNVLVDVHLQIQHPNTEEWANT